MSRASFFLGDRVIGGGGVLMSRAFFPLWLLVGGGSCRICRNSVTRFFYPPFGFFTNQPYLGCVNHIKIFQIWL
jgi:hypothetical protein